MTKTFGPDFLAYLLENKSQSYSKVGVFKKTEKQIKPRKPEKK
jgi:hypothetical protein